MLASWKRLLLTRWWFVATVFGIIGAAGAVVGTLVRDRAPAEALGYGLLWGALWFAAGALLYLFRRVMPWHE